MRRECSSHPGVIGPAVKRLAVCSLMGLTLLVSPMGLEPAEGANKFQPTFGEIDPMYGVYRLANMEMEVLVAWANGFRRLIAPPVLSNMHTASDPGSEHYARIRNDWARYIARHFLEQHLLNNPLPVPKDDFDRQDQTEFKLSWTQAAMEKLFPLYDKAAERLRKNEWMVLSVKHLSGFYDFSKEALVFNLPWPEIHVYGGPYRKYKESLEPIPDKYKLIGSGIRLQIPMPRNQAKEFTRRNRIGENGIPADVIFRIPEMSKSGAILTNPPRAPTATRIPTNTRIQIQHVIGFAPDGATPILHLGPNISRILRPDEPVPPFSLAAPKLDIIYKPKKELAAGERDPRTFRADDMVGIWHYGTGPEACRDPAVFQISKTDADYQLKFWQTKDFEKGLGVTMSDGSGYLVVTPYGVNLFDQDADRLLFYPNLDGKTIKVINHYKKYDPPGLMRAPWFNCAGLAASAAAAKAAPALRPKQTPAPQVAAATAEPAPAPSEPAVAKAEPAPIQEEARAAGPVAPAPAVQGHTRAALLGAWAKEGASCSRPEFAILPLGNVFRFEFLMEGKKTNAGIEISGDEAVVLLPGGELLMQLTEKPGRILFQGKRKYGEQLSKKENLAYVRCSGVQEANAVPPQAELERIGRTASRLLGTWSNPAPSPAQASCANIMFKSVKRGSYFFMVNPAKNVSDILHLEVSGNRIKVMGADSYMVYELDDDPKSIRLVEVYSPQKGVQTGNAYLTRCDS